jgi:topoisomerase IA-like protein
MRTDSTVLSQDAESAVEDAIRTQFGAEFVERYVPRTVSRKKDKFAQEAHEAIRPAIQANGKFYTPNELPPTVPPGPATELYRMIYQRTQAYRMPPLITNQTQVTIRGVNGETEMLFRTTGRVVLSPGYTLAYQLDDDSEEGDATDGTKVSAQILPPLVEGQILELDDLISVRHETQPPPRYTEASFVKELEALGVGRPSTFAGIVQTLRDRAYIGNPISANDDGGNYGRRGGGGGGGKTWTGSAISAMRAAGGQDFVGNGSARGPLVPSLSAFVVCALLEAHCPTYVDPNFTARMEDRLDEIASGGGDDDDGGDAISAEEKRIEYLNEFYAGENGLAAQIKRIDESVDASIARRAILPTMSEGDAAADESDDQVGLFIGPWGPYVQKLTSDTDSDASDKPPTTSLPPSMAADISTIKMSTLKTLLATKQEGGTLLGQHPVDGRNIRIKTGRYGVYLQWGDDKEEGTTTHTLPKSRVHMRHVETLHDEFDGDASESLGSLFRISLDEAVAFCSLPRTVSTIEEKPIIAAFGPYGPYLKYNEKYLRIKPDDADILSIDAETAERLVQDGIINALPRSSKSVVAVVGMMYGANVGIRKRKYGLYVEWKGLSTKLPAECSESPRDVTLEQAWSMLESDRRKQLLSVISEMKSDPESDAVHKLVMQKRKDKDHDTKLKSKSETKEKKIIDKSGLSRRPKRPLTSYLHFCAVQRPAVAESVKTLGEISKKLASLWAETSESDRQVYVQMASESKLKYDEEMRMWEEESAKSQSTSSSSKSKSKSRATVKEERKMSSMESTTVPRAPSAYMLFCRDERPKVLDPKTEMKLPFVETTQRLATLWRECDDTVKEKYQQLAMIEKARLQQLHHDSTMTKHQ